MRRAAEVSAGRIGEFSKAWEDDAMNAVFVKEVDRGERTDGEMVRFGKAAVYRLDPPDDGVDHVFVSESCIMGVWETYIFACKEDGEVTDWSEMRGSERCTKCHATVLRNMGYEIKETP